MVVVHGSEARNVHKPMKIGFNPANMGTAILDTHGQNQQLDAAECTPSFAGSNRMRINIKKNMKTQFLHDASSFKALKAQA